MGMTAGASSLFSSAVVAGLVGLGAYFSILARELDLIEQYNVNSLALQTLQGRALGPICVTWRASLVLTLYWLEIWAASRTRASFERRCTSRLLEQQPLLCL